LSKIAITEDDDEALRSWNFSSNSAFNREILSILKQDKFANGGLGDGNGDGNGAGNQKGRKYGNGSMQSNPGPGGCCSIS
jgi:hypothetical protein